jgi:tetratricopeptide (TPR) repeat protein/DNA-binding CsgD family transcriptional regulator
MKLSRPPKEVSLSVLKARLKRTVRPKERLWAMLRLAEKLAAHEATHANQALLLFTEAEQLARDIQDRRGMAAAVHGAGYCQFLLSNLFAALESFERALPIAEETGDAEREILILRDMGSSYMGQRHPDLALATLQKCAELAELIGNVRVQASAFDLIGILFRNFDRYHESLEYLAKGLLLLDGTAWARDQAIILLHMGNVLHALGRNAEALSALKQSSQLGRAAEDHRIEGICQGMIGIVYSDLGDYPNALSLFLVSATILEQVGDKLNLAKTYANIVNLNLQLGNTEQMISLAGKALVMFEEIGDKRGQTTLYGNLGRYYLDRGQVVQAKRSLKQSLAIAQEIGSKGYEVATLTQMAEMEAGLGKFTVAEKLYRKALIIASSGDDQNRTVAILLGLGALFNKRSEPGQAIPILERAIAIAVEIYSIRYEQEAHQGLVEAFETIGDIKRALKHSKLASNIKEEILGIEKQKAIIQLQVRSDIERSEMEKALLQKEAEFKSQESERMMMHLAEKTELIRTVRRRIRKIVGEGAEGIVDDAGTLHAFDELLSELGSDHSAGRRRTIFNDEFQQVHRELLSKLTQSYPSLTITERKICVLLAEGFSIKQMSEILKVAHHTVEIHRHAVRKKMKLGRGASLNTVLAGM